MQLINDFRGASQPDIDETQSPGNADESGQESASLHVVGIQKSLGGVPILKGITLQAESGRITGIIGPNGAGKSTLLNVIGGLLKPDAGQILSGGRDLTPLAMRERARFGLVRTFQLSRELGELTVLENLLVAPLNQSGESVINAFLKRRQFRSEERAAGEKARQLLLKVGLWTLADALARTLSGGQKKLLELSRALMLEPRIILLDEPAAGVSPPMRDEICRLIQDLRASGKTLVIVEHDMDVVAKLCDHVCVISEGATLTKGRFKDVVSDERVIRAYFGGVV